MTSPTTVATGYYGMRGWTTEKRIKNVLKPYLNLPLEDGDDSHVLESYEPFQGLGAVGAQRLLGTLPLRNLADRQNFAPTCEALLERPSITPDSSNWSATQSDRSVPMSASQSKGSSTTVTSTFT